MLGSNIIIVTLLVVIFIQWIILSYCIASGFGGNICVESSLPSSFSSIENEDGHGGTATVNKNTTQYVKISEEVVTEKITTTLNDEKKEKEQVVPLVSYRGVAVTLMLDNPPWFQRRYTSMVHNIIMNIPNDWIVQIFYTGTGKSQIGLVDLNPGLMRLIVEDDNDQNNTNIGTTTYQKRIILTRLPEKMVKSMGTKRKLKYWADPWIWKNMVSSNVLTFGGGGAICSNSKLSLLLNDANNNKLYEILNKFDYIGTPWRFSKGWGGDGTISLRKRDAMLDALEYKPHNGNEAEDQYFVRMLQEMNTNFNNRKTIDNKGEEVTTHRRYDIASPNDTQLFGGTNGFTSDTSGQNVPSPPFVIVGTLPRLEQQAREMVLAVCPEIKIIFPSLHNPACFGAKPNSEGCEKSICALKDPKERGAGGC